MLKCKIVLHHLSERETDRQRQRGREGGRGGGKNRDRGGERDSIVEAPSGNNN